jgi:acyl-CoA thioesterase
MATSTLDLVRARMRGDRFAARCGIRLLAVRSGFARAALRLRPDHRNGLDVAQGGAIFTLADFAFAAASNSHGVPAVALDVAITFARAARTGVLTAEAREVALSRKVSVCEVRVTDAGGALVAAFRGTAYRKDDVAVPRELARRRPARATPPAKAGRPLRRRSPDR